MSNRVRLDQLDLLTIGEVASLPIEELAMLTDEADQMTAKAKHIKEILHGAMCLRYEAQATSMRLQDGRDTGVVHIQDEGFSVSCDLPARPKWDQKALRHAIETVASWGSDPTEYVTTEYKVSEARFKAWPGEIRSVFEPARTVETGRQSFKIKRGV